jgi:hypothetical protein
VEATLRTPRRRSGRWTLFSGIALIAVGVLSFNAYANFSATTNYNQQMSTGTMTLTKANEASATKAYNLTGSDLAPGDTMQRGLLLTVGGTVSASALTVQGADAAPTDLDDGSGIDMTLKVDVCDQAWDETLHSGIPTYACAGSEQVVLAATDLGDVIASPQTLANTDLAGANHLRLTWELPAGAGNSFQNTALAHPSNTVTLTFTAPQRAATDK